MVSFQHGNNRHTFNFVNLLKFTYIINYAFELFPKHSNGINGKILINLKIFDIFIKETVYFESNRFVIKI